MSEAYQPQGMRDVDQMYREIASVLNSHEIIEGVYRDPWHVDTKSIDICTWVAAYTNGYRKPNYPMPVTIENAETAGNWLSLSLCPWPNPPCRACIEKWEDQMLYDFPWLED